MFAAGGAGRAELFTSMLSTENAPSRSVLTLSLLLLPSLGYAQPVQNPVQEPAAAQNTKQKKKSTKRTDGTSNDRLLFVLPNFLTLENAANTPPLTTGQKFKATARGTFDPVEFVWYGMQAGISQARNDDAIYGQGMEGFAKRYGVRFADGTIQNFFTKAIYPSLLREDPRYFQLGEGGFLHRTFYAVSRVFVTRTDAGGNTFNFSEVLGSATAAGISSYTYHPADAHNVDNALHVCVTQVAYDVLSNVVKEFWPDLRRKLHKTNVSDAQSVH